jgi:uncharacterized protein YjiS (DUF1127 family)
MDGSTTVSTREMRITAPATTAGLAMVANTISRCVAWVRHQQSIRRDIATLMALDDHLLADMGLSSNTIRQAVRNGLPLGSDGAKLRWQPNAGRG